MTEIEKYILNACGWTEDQMEHFGFLRYKVKSASGAGILELKTSFDENLIKVIFAIPNEKGEVVNWSFDRKKQSMTNDSDKDLKEDEDIFIFFNMIQSSIKDSRGLFFPVQKIQP